MKQPSDNRVVLGIYRTRAGVEYGVSELQSAGFRSSDISALFPVGDHTRDFAHVKGTKAPEGTATGGITGGAIGGIIGWLIGAGALSIPGAGTLIAAGPIVAALAGAGLGGTVGGIAGALIGMGIPEYEAKRYEGVVKEGGILVSIHCDSREWQNYASEILQRTNAQEISATVEAPAPKDAKLMERSLSL